MKRTTLAPAMAALLLATAAGAQETPSPPPAGTTPPAATEPTPAPTPPAAQAPAATPAPSTSAGATAPVLTDEQASALKNKAIWSSDEKNVGEVAEVVRDSTGRVTELHADIGGFLGFGETRVKITADEFKMVGDRIVLTRTEEQVKALPKVIEN